MSETTIDPVDEAKALLASLPVIRADRGILWVGAAHFVNTNSACRAGDDATTAALARAFSPDGGLLAALVAEVERWRAGSRPITATHDDSGRGMPPHDADGCPGWASKANK